METQSKIKAKRSYPSPAQKARLIALIEADKELHQGKFSSTFTKKESERRWQQIAEEINSIFGAKKAWMEWRKTWQDMKAAAKKKHSAIRHSVHSTGGGPPTQPLSEDDLAILSTMAEPTLVGHQDSQESCVEFLDLPSSSAVFSDPSSAVAKQEGNQNKELPEPDVSSVNSATVLHTSKEDNKELPEPDVSSVNSATVLHTSKEDNKENKKARKVKPVGRRRQLEQSLTVASNLQNHLNEKLKIKKEFYENILKEMRKQTNILMSISNNLSGPQQEIQNQEMELEVLDHDYC